MIEWKKQLEDLIQKEQYIDPSIRETIHQAEEKRRNEFQTFIDSIGRDTLCEALELFKSKGINGSVDVSTTEASIELFNGFELVIEDSRVYLKPQDGRNWNIIDLPPLQEYTKKALTELIISAYSEFLKEDNKDKFRY